MCVVRHRVNRRLVHLRRLFSRLDVPLTEPTSYRIPPTPPRNLPQESLQQLGYLYDCFGNLFFCSRTRRFMINLDSVHRWIPALLWDKLGGKLVVRPGSEGNRSAFHWRLCGAKAVEAAQALSPYTRCKRRILEEFKRFDFEQKAKLQNLVSSLKKNLKVGFFPEGKVQSWSDVAQLFDTRGSIRMLPRSSSIRIIIKHHNQHLLQSLTNFLGGKKQRLTLQPKVTRQLFYRKNYLTHVWVLQGEEQASSILEKVLDNGILLQKARAERALEIVDGKADLHYLPPRNNTSRHKSLSLEEAQLNRLIAYFRKKRRSPTCHTEEVQLYLEVFRKLKDASKRRTLLLRVREEIKDTMKAHVGNPNYG